jgi:2-phospho-L-lactate guanylyltransferase
VKTLTANKSDIWAVIPVKETAGAKQRLAAAIPAHLRKELALTMLEDVLMAVSRADDLAGIMLATRDAAASRLADRYGARILTTDADRGHTAAVAAAARILAADGAGGMMQLPGDIPLVTPEEISLVLSRHRPAPSFTIVPSHDDFGSNAVVVSPPGAVPLSFGDDSFFPHLKVAQAHGIDPVIVRLPGIGRDIDNANDLSAFAAMHSATRTQAFLDQNAFADWARLSYANSRENDGQ